MIEQTTSLTIFPSIFNLVNFNQKKMLSFKEEMINVNIVLVLD